IVYKKAVYFTTYEASSQTECGEIGSSYFWGLTTIKGEGALLYKMDSDTLLGSTEDKDRIEVGEGFSTQTVVNSVAYIGNSDKLHYIRIQTPTKKCKVLYWKEAPPQSGRCPTGDLGSSPTNP
ncbi:MAG: hypothetical protein V1872_01335, partial [bacterium]